MLSEGGDAEFDEFNRSWEGRLTLKIGQPSLLKLSTEMVQDQIAKTGRLRFAVSRHHAHAELALRLWPRQRALSFLRASFSIQPSCTFVPILSA